MGPRRPGPAGGSTGHARRCRVRGTRHMPATGTGRNVPMRSSPAPTAQTRGGPAAGSMITISTPTPDDLSPSARGTASDRAYDLTVVHPKTSGGRCVRMTLHLSLSQRPPRLCSDRDTSLLVNRCANTGSRPALAGLHERPSPQISGRAGHNSWRGGGIAIAEGSRTSATPEGLGRQPRSYLHRRPGC